METPRYSDPLGFTIVLTEAADATDEKCLQADVWLEPKAQGPPLHIHPTFEERLDLVSGRVGVQVGKERRTLAPGEGVVAAPKVPHRFWNETDEPARLLSEIRPPSEQFLSFLASLTALRQAGKTKQDGQPGFLQGAVLLDEYLDVVALPGLPIAVQRAGFGLLGSIGRLLGYRVIYPEVAAR